jgi:hypothetical protein
MRQPPKKAFTFGDWSVRPFDYLMGNRVWHAYKKRDRSWSRGEIMETRGGCFLVSVSGHPFDAFSSWELALHDLKNKLGQIV